MFTLRMLNTALRPCDHYHGKWSAPRAWSSRGYSTTYSITTSGVAMGVAIGVMTKELYKDTHYYYT
jgi:hypothetical protein